MSDREYYLSALSEMLPHKRYYHSVRCADTAETLAEQYGVDKEKAWIAGLLHDISRGRDRQTIRDWAVLDKGLLTEYENQHFNVLHGYASAWYCRKTLGIEDGSILDAIRFHTTGVKGMDMLAKVVFVSDYLEPGREHLSREDYSRLVSLPINRLVVTILEATEDYLKSKRVPLSPLSGELYRELTKR